MPLTDLAARNAKPKEKQYKLSDAEGMYLLVKPNGSKLWRWKYRIAGKEYHFAIGEYPSISLLEARKARDDARSLVKQGVHPSHQRKTERLATHAEHANTFEAIAKEWIAQKKPRWTPYYLLQVERFMAANVYPKIGSFPIRQVTSAHLLDILRTVESRGAASVAVNLRQWCGAVFRYAISTLRAETDLAHALKGAIHKPPTRHSKPLNSAELKRLIGSIDEKGGWVTTKIAVRLMMLTFLRTTELRAAEWREIDLENALWRVPAERMKMKDEHLVPLSKQSVGLLRQLHELTGSQGYLFPNTRRPKACMTGTTINRALERMGFAGKEGIGFSGHGFRSTASTMLNEAGYRADVIERQLAHAERNRVRASYNRAEYLPERIAMMQAWADMVDKIAAGKPVSPINDLSA